MKNVLVILPLKDEHKQMLEEISPDLHFYYTQGERASIDKIAEANIIIGSVSPKVMHHACQLEFMQLSSAGSEGYTKPGVLRPGAILANASGAYGPVISEHMLGMLLLLYGNLGIYMENMKRHLWEYEGDARTISGSRTLVVGMGDIGSEFARKMSALGSTVVGIRRHNAAVKPDYAEAVYTMDALDEELRRADIIACTLPGIPGTYHLFDEKRMNNIKRGAVLLNVGRGSLISTEVLCKALEGGTLGGACLDVAEEEPLPSDSPLWTAPNLIITPHISGISHMEAVCENVVQIAVKNLRAFCEGRPIMNEVDLETGYRKLENRV